MEILEAAAAYHREQWSAFARHSIGDLAAEEKRLHESAQLLLGIAQTDATERDTPTQRPPHAPPQKKQEG